MSMSLLFLFEQMANADAAFGLVARVARFLQRLAQQSPDDGNRRKAVAETLNEWENVAGLLDSRIEEGMREVPSGRLGLRAEALAFLAEKYLESSRSPGRRAEPVLRHSRVNVADDQVLVSFGQSSETRVLGREELAIPLRDLSSSTSSPFEGRPSGGSMALPVFKVTMLGDSGSGKTVFMSSMYAKLRDGARGISIKAIDDAVDLELGDVMENLYKFHKWPPGSDFDQKQYNFELQLQGRSIARIDWVDYRGGALLEGDQKGGGGLLNQRLQESHAILWMVDMTRLQNGRLEGIMPRIETRVARMAHICRHAVKDHGAPRAWVFVRTKSDTVRDLNGSPNWEKACSDLIRHLGETIHIASGGNSRAAAVPVSASGRLSGDGTQVMGEDPTLVEWPLILSLAFLMDAEFSQLKRAKGQALDQYQTARSSRLDDFVRSFLRMGPSQDEMQTWQRANSIGRQLSGMHQVIGELLQDCPSVIKLLHEKTPGSLI